VARRAVAHLVSWLTPSEVAARRWMVGASLITIVMLPFAVYQLYDLKEQRERRVVNALLMINQRLDVETSRVIRHRLQSLNPQPLLDGSISADSLGDYLDTMDSLASLLARHLVDLESVNEWFGDLIERTAANFEVRAYIRESQLQDLSYYTGFEKMAQEIARLNPTRRLELRRPKSR